MVDTTHQYKLIIFDWDGTLMDSQERIVNCLRASARDIGLESRTDDELKNIIGLGLHEAINELYPAIIDEHRQQYIERYRYHFITADDTPTDLFDDVHDLLAHLSDKGYFISIATGKARAGLNRVLEDTGLKEAFHGTRCSDETRSKPHPLMLEELLQEFGVAAHEAVMIGDSEYDMLMAKSLGMDSVAVSYGVHELERLMKHSPVHTVDNISQLLSWFEQRVICTA